MNNTLERILELKESRNLTDSEFERKLDLKPKTIDNWRRNLSKSYLKILAKIADYFCVSVDYLLGHSASPSAAFKQQRKPNQVTMIGKDGEYVTYEIPEEDMATVRKMIEAMQRDKK